MHNVKKMGNQSQLIGQQNADIKKNIAAKKQQEQQLQAEAQRAGLDIRFQLASFLLKYSLDRSTIRAQFKEIVTWLNKYPYPTVMSYWKLFGVAYVANIEEGIGCGLNDVFAAVEEAYDIFLNEGINVEKEG